MLNSALYSNPHGLAVRSQTLTVYNNSGVTTAIGEVFQLDMGSVTATTYTDTSATSVFGGIIKVTATGALAYPLVVAMEVAAVSTNLKVTIVGVVPVMVKGTNAAALTDTLHAVSGDEELNSDTAANARVIGIPLEVTAGSSAELIDVLFDGTGLGSK